MVKSLLAVTLAAAGLGVALSVATPATAATVSKPLRTMIADLPVATEVRTGYNRDLFPHWIDADGDGCNTRYEVLIAEAVTAPTVGSGCSLSGGRWYSYYDGAYWTATSDIDIDHFVPLAEAWDSGARNWTTAQRQSFANDLGDSRSLVGVTDNVNQSKSDQDPAEWLPPLSNVRCRYIGEWAAVKTRWALTVDSAEKSALTSLANSCSNVTITVQTVLGGGGTTPPPSGCTATNSTNVTIPDDTTVNSPTTISGCSGSASATSTVEVHIVHTYIGDLLVQLVAPDGSLYTLHNRGGGSADNINQTYPVNLSSESRNGTWNLRVNDNYPEDTGYIDSWTLRL